MFYFLIFECNMELTGLHGKQILSSAISMFLHQTVVEMKDDPPNDKFRRRYKYEQSILQFETNVKTFYYHSGKSFLTKTIEGDQDLFLYACT